MTPLATLKEGEVIARAHHTRNMDRQLNTAREKVKELLQGFDTMEADFRVMAKCKMDTGSAKAYIERIFPLPEDRTDTKAPAWILEDRANCLHLYRDGIGNHDPAIKETLWAAYNGITEYVDHWRDRGERQHLYTVCLGRGFQIKSRAYTEALKITGSVAMN